LAARTDLKGTQLEQYRANIDGVRNIIYAARTLKRVERIVFGSSMLVCPLGYQPHSDDDYKPSTIYGTSKAIGEQLVRTLAGITIPWVIVRPTSLWGPWFDVPYRQFFDAVMSGWYLHPKGVKVHRSYGFVLNSVHQLHALALAQEKEINFKVYYVADYVPVELRDWAQQIREVADAPRIRDVPLSVLRVLARCGDLLKRTGMRNPPITSFRLQNLLTEAIYDLEPLMKVIGGDLPYDVRQGIEITVEWIRNHSTLGMCNFATL
jgi:nucleoside-diphosphate-sugar epimerase